jgi:tRNA pseudouridine38-40 synthase
VTEDFHARFSAIKRHYLYRLIDRRSPLTLDKGQIWRVPQPLDSDAMHAAAQCLVGSHDFSTFRDAQCQSDSPVKTLDAIRVSRIGEEVQLTCSARSFLHRQVRSFVGSLVEVGLGKWSIRDFKAALDAADRQRCGPVAPSDGLYLVAVDYPD